MARQEVTYTQVDKEEWGHRVGLCTIHVKTPDGSVYELNDALVTVEKKTDYIDHMSGFPGIVDQVVPINCQIELRAVSHNANVSDGDETQMTEYDNSALRVVKAYKPPTRIIRFNRKRKT